MNKRFLSFLLFFIVITTASATVDNYEFDSPAQRQLFLNLTEELRCPMCQNQNIADSDAMISHDMRRKVYSLVRDGKTEDEIIAFMKSRYGDFISYQPPVTPVTLWLWLGPVLFAAIAITIVFLRRKSKLPVDMTEKLARAEAMLEQDK